MWKAFRILMLIFTLIPVLPAYVAGEGAGQTAVPDGVLALGGDTLWRVENGWDASDPFTLTVIDPASGDIRQTMRGEARAEIVTVIGDLCIVSETWGAHRVLAYSEASPDPIWTIPDPSAWFFGADATTLFAGRFDVGMAGNTGVTYQQIVAIDAQSGAELWRFPEGAAYQNALLTLLYEYAADGMVFVQDPGTGRVQRIDSTSGAPLWSGPATSGGTGVKATADGLVFADDGAAVYAMDANTGQERWRMPVLEASGATVFRTIRATGGHLFVEVGFPEPMAPPERDVPTRLIALDTATGMVRWQFPADSTVLPAAVSLGADTNLVLVKSGGTVTALDPGTGTAAWRTDVTPFMHIASVTTTHVILSSALEDEAAYSDGPLITVLDIADGQVAWSADWSGILVDEVICRDGTVYALGRGLAALDESTGDTKWQTAEPGIF